MGGKTQRKKELLEQYRERTITGGVYKITNTANGRYLLKGELNLPGRKNLFDFSQQTNSCMLSKLKDDWQKFGPAAFNFEILEEVERKETQTAEEFKEDLKVLQELWQEKFDLKNAY